MSDRNHYPVLSVSSCLTALLGGMIIFIALFVFFSLSGLNAREESGEKGAQMTLIPAPTITVTPLVTEAPQRLDVRYVSPEGLFVGALVEVSGTGETGLSVRPQAGTGGVLNFVARDGERYRVVDGPDAKNDYVWWKLQSPDDETKNGWAAADYLTLVSE